MRGVFGSSWNAVRSILRPVWARVHIRRTSPDRRNNALGLRLARSAVQRMAKEEPPPRKS